MASVSSESGRSISDFSDEEIHQMIEKTLQTIDVLSAETEMFERHLNRLDPQEKKTMKVSVFQYTHGRKHDSSGIRQKRSKSQRLIMEKMVYLDVGQKCDIALKEIERLSLDIKRYHDQSEKSAENFQAMSEEADMCMKEMKKDAYEFEREIIKGAICQQTKTVKAEKCIRYFELKLKNRDLLREKMLLKHSTLKIQERKIAFQLQQKEEIGEVIDAVDFSQLKILNQRYDHILVERNKDLLRMKLVAGSTTQMLNSNKRRLQTLTKQSSQLGSELTSRSEFKRKLEAETQMIEMERSEAEKTNKSLRTHLAKYHVPKIMEYVLEKDGLYNIQQKMRTWERKVNLAEAALGNYSKTWMRMKRVLQCMPNEKQMVRRN